MYIYVYILTHISVCTHAWICIHSNIRIHARTYLSKQLAHHHLAHIHTHKYTHKHTYKYVYILTVNNSVNIRISHVRKGMSHTYRALLIEYRVLLNG